jgi:hypothetical protein
MERPDAKKATDYYLVVSAGSDTDPDILLRPKDLRQHLVPVCDPCMEGAKIVPIYREVLNREERCHFIRRGSDWWYVPGVPKKTVYWDPDTGKTQSEIENH